MASTLLKSANANTLPITAAEFLTHLQPIWKRQRASPSAAGGLRLGLCVSGGPDSMALAFLCEKVRDEELCTPFQLHGFIVDHQARTGSTEEAHVVSRRLENMGIQSEILTMHWPEGVEPRSLSNFESQARSNRFRLLALAAVRSGVDDLLLGQHMDDQVETVLMRLMRGSARGMLKAFHGIQAQNSIPCSSLVWGAHGEAVPWKEGFKTHLDLPKSGQQSVASLALSSQGIMLHRPLLEFPKTRLVATCNSNGVDYVSDSTNFDPRLTRRNAIRHLYTSYKMPRALSKPSIIACHGISKQSRAESAEALQRLFAKTKLRVDLRSGKATVGFPQGPELRALDTELAVKYLRGLIDIVSPRDRDVEMNSSFPVDLHYIFPSTFSKIDDLDDRENAPRAHTVDRVLIECLNPKASKYDIPVWQFSRQSLRQGEAEKATIYFSTAYGATSDTRGDDWSSWCLWDNRFWLRIRLNKAGQKKLGFLRIRPFIESDSSKIKNTNPLEFDHLHSVLADAAPGPIRYTLPVIDDGARIVAFPTLGIMLSASSDGSGRVQQPQPGWLEIQVQYKSVDDIVQICALSGQLQYLPQETLRGGI